MPKLSDFDPKDIKLISSPESDVLQDTDDESLLKEALETLGAGTAAAGQGFSFGLGTKVLSALETLGESKDLSDLEKLYQRYKELSGKRQSCIQAFARIIVLHDGRMTLCCPNFNEDESLMVGNVDQEGIYKAFNSDKAKLARLLLKNGKAFDSEPCKSCASFESYEGFRAKWKA